MDVERFVELARVATHGPDVVLRIVGGDVDNVRASVQRRDLQIKGFECPVSVRFDVTIEVIAPTQELGIAHFWDSEIDGTDSTGEWFYCSELVEGTVLLALGARDVDAGAGVFSASIDVPARFHGPADRLDCYRIRPGFNGHVLVFAPLLAGERLTIPLSLACAKRGRPFRRHLAWRAADALLGLEPPSKEVP